MTGSYLPVLSVSLVHHNRIFQNFAVHMSAILTQFLLEPFLLFTYLI